jgi:hypothetical protein
MDSVNQMPLHNSFFRGAPRNEEDFGGDKLSLVGAKRAPARVKICPACVYATFSIGSYDKMVARNFGGFLNCS